MKKLLSSILKRTNRNNENQRLNEGGLENEKDNPNTIREIIGNGALAHDFVLLQKILDNQNDVIDMLLKEYQHVHIITRNPIGGTRENYYHFIFDLILPLSFILPKLNKEIYLQFYSFGPLTSLLKELFGKRIKIIDNKNLYVKPVEIIGLSPVILKKCDFNFETLRELVFHNLQINPPTQPSKVILIQRVKPDPYYQSEAILKGGGSKRRAIKNHLELSAMLKKLIRPEYEFQNLVLEEMSFTEQVHHFSEAVLIIGLHGAGLTNTIWMQPRTHVVEIGFKDRLHFQKNCNSMQQVHYKYKNFYKNQIATV